MSGYVLSTDADLDLNEIWAHIARDNVDAADRWINKLLKHSTRSLRIHVSDIHAPI